jgi:hypothetical protein
MASTVPSRVGAGAFSGASLDGLDFPGSGAPGTSAWARERRGMGGKVIAGLASEEGPAGAAAALPEDPVPSSASWSNATVRVRGIGGALAGRWPFPAAAVETEGGVWSGACLVSEDEAPVGPEAEPVPAPDDEPPAAPEGARPSLKKKDSHNSWQRRH